MDKQFAAFPLPIRWGEGSRERGSVRKRPKTPNPFTSSSRPEIFKSSLIIPTPPKWFPRPSRDPPASL